VSLVIPFSASIRAAVLAFAFLAATLAAPACADGNSRAIEERAPFSILLDRDGRAFPCKYHDCSCAEQGRCTIDCCCFSSAARDRRLAGEQPAATSIGIHVRVDAPGRDSSPGPRVSSEHCHRRGHPVNACGVGPGAEVPQGSPCIEGTRDDRSDACVCVSPRAPKSRGVEPPTPPPRAVS
jgi:hypothetical protein